MKHIALRHASRGRFRLDFRFYLTVDCLFRCRDLFQNKNLRQFHLLEVLYIALIFRSMRVRGYVIWVYSYCGFSSIVTETPGISPCQRSIVSL